MEAVLVFLTESIELFLQNGIVAVADEAGALGFSVLHIRERSELNAKQLVRPRPVRHKRGVLLFLQRIDQCFRVILLADCGDLHKISAGRGRSCSLR